MGTSRLTQMLSTASSRPASVLARALADDALFGYFFPPSWISRPLLWSFFRDEIRFRRRTGQVLVHRSAVALLGDWPVADLPLDELSVLTRIMLRLQGGEARAHWEGTADLGRRRPNGPHRYLSVIGTEPKRQGRGDGTVLLGQVVAGAREAGLDLYLETGSERLRDWYARYGFEVLADERLAGGPSVFEMVCRTANPAANAKG